MIELLLEAERALAMGRVDQAERLYRQSADADPRNSIAVVGLARVALERGDEPGAWGLGRRALDIDPENVAAQRLVERLEEVWAYRGESLADAAAATGGPPPTAGTPDGPTGAASAPGTGTDAAAVATPAPAKPATPEPATPDVEPAATSTLAASHRSVIDRLLRRNRP